jgi:hypothetical protein
MFKTSKLITKKSIFVFTGLIALLSTSCGVSKVAQCSSFDQVAKEVATVSKELDSQDTKDIDKTAQLFSHNAAKGQEFSKAFQSLDLQDKKLKGFQSDFVAIYQGYSKSFGQISLAAKNKDADSFNKPIAELQTASVKEKALAKELAEYCTGK